MDLINPIFYPCVTDNLSAFRELVGEEFELFLSIRRQHQVFPSAYVQSLRGGGSPFDLAEHIRAQIADRKVPSWAELICRIRNKFPNINMTVWTFDAYCKDKEKLLNEVFDTKFPVKAPNIPVSTKSPSQKIVSIVSSVFNDTNIDLENRKILIGKIFNSDIEYMKNYQCDNKFNPVAKSERGELEEV